MSVGTHALSVIFALPNFNCSAFLEGISENNFGENHDQLRLKAGN
jgi:hypothetical protein